MSQTLNLQLVPNHFVLKDHVHKVLKSAIVEMNIYDSDAVLKLDERKLSEQLGISRTPIREALARLEQDGFVEIQPRRGVYIKRKSLKDILEMTIVWAALESMAARLATVQASDEELASLWHIAGQWSANSSEPGKKVALKGKKSANKSGGRPGSADISEYSEINIQFHERILELSKCTMLKGIADTLFLHMYAVRRRALGENNRANTSVVDHIEIIEALETRNGELAAELVHAHTMRLHDHIRETWTRLESRAQAS